MPLQQFTEAQARAWNFIRSAVNEGIGATAAFDDYKATGEKIRTQDFYRAYNAYKEAGSVWDELPRFRDNETLPERMWLGAPRNFSQPYVAEVTMQVRNLESRELTTITRYIESNQRMSPSEIRQGVQDAIEEMSTTGTLAPKGEEMQLEFIYGTQFYKSGEIK